MATKVKSDGGATVQIRLDADPSAPQRARRAVERLGDHLDARAVDDLRAVVSELVAIGLSSPEKLIEVQIDLRDEQVTGEVRYPRGAPRAIRGSGRALRIIGALVAEWEVAADQAFCFRLP